MAVVYGQIQSLVMVLCCSRLCWGITIKIQKEILDKMAKLLAAEVSGSRFEVHLPLSKQFVSSELRIHAF